MLLGLFVYGITNAQEYDKTASFGFFTGVINYQGDLNPNSFTLNHSNFATGIFTRKPLNRWLTLRAGITIGKIEASDSWNRDYLKSRNLSFTTSVKEAYAGFEITVLDMSAKRFTPYFYGGIAVAAWDLETALQLIPQLKELGVELVEQPLAKEDWEGMKVLYKESSLPLYADESCVVEQDVERCKDHFHGINIKLTKCSGITPARRMIQKARELSMHVMIGCMNESTVGAAAIAHLLPFIDHVDMDGPLLLEDDLATGIGYNYGKISYSGNPGLGITYTGLFSKKFD